MEAKQAKRLLKKYCNQTCTIEEQKLVEEWYQICVDAGKYMLSEEEAEQIKDCIRNSLDKKINKKNLKLTPLAYLSVKVKWAAASIIMLALCYYYIPFSEKTNTIVSTRESKTINDIDPAHENVILKLSDGTVKKVDEMIDGAVSFQGVRVVKSSSSISYSGVINSPHFVNTIYTEKGRTFHIQLSDGTNVWLDALSSIKFPVVFNGSERKVEITGQAYLEVAKKKEPFKVITANQIVEVLGTRFNINSYDTNNIATTLIEGKVLVNVKNNSSRQSCLVLNKNQQSILSSKTKLILKTDNSIEEVLAWHYGIFQFNGKSVNDIMNELSRWYDINVVFEDNITERFVAQINRDLPLSEIINLLEATGQIKFKITGNRVIIMR